MRHISKEISLEEFKSRVPGFIPAFHQFDRTVNVDEDGLTGGTVVFDGTTLDNVHEDANYGMFPSDVERDGKVYTYPDIRKAYTFFRDYYSVLRKPNCGGRTDYPNAVAMYESEGASQPLSLEECEEMDSIAESYGADLENGTCELYDDILDDMMRSEKIPDEFAGEWGTDRIAHADVRHWRNWFRSTRDAIDAGEADCCLEEKYARLGGDAMLDFLSGITAEGGMRHFTSLDRASIDVPLAMAVKIDEMGEFTPICETYEAGVEYSYSTDGNATVVVKDGNTYIRNSEPGQGYRRNDELVRDEWDPGQWEPYDDDGNPMFTSYAYKGMEIYVNPIEGYEVPEEYLLTPANMCDRYPLRTGRLFLIKGTVYETFRCRYTVYMTKGNSPMNGSFLEVKSDGGIPYVMVNGRKRRAVMEGGRYVFDFGYKPCVVDKGNILCEIEDDGEFIARNGSLRKVTDEMTVTVDGVEYSMADACADTEAYGTVMFTDGDAVEPDVEYASGTGRQTWREFNGMGARVLSADTVDEHTSGYDADYEAGELVIYKPYTVYNANVVNGTCDSKLEHLMDARRSYDDYGNELPGCYHAGGSSSPVPSEGELLDIPYHVGNVNSCEYLVETISPDGVFKNFNGDLITQIAFYFKDVEGKVVEDTVVKVNNSNYIDESHKSNIRFIKECEQRKVSIVENNVDNVIFDEKLYCDITYCIGNPLSVFHGEDGKVGYYEVSLSPYGSILYTDTFTLEKSEAVYHFAGGDDYKVSYYRMEPEIKKVVLDDFRYETVEVPQSRFVLNLNGDGKEYEKNIDWLLIWFSWIGTKDLDISVTTSKLPEGFDAGGVGYGRKYDGSINLDAKNASLCKDGWYPDPTYKPNGNKDYYNTLHPHILWCNDDTGGLDAAGLPKTAYEGVAVSMGRYYNGFKPSDPNHKYEYAGIEDDNIEININACWFEELKEGHNGDFTIVVKTYNGGEIVYNKDKKVWENNGGVELESMITTAKTKYQFDFDWTDPNNSVATIKYNKETKVLTVRTNEKNFSSQTIKESATIKSPTIMEDAKFGMVLRQSVDGNIYVNRGVNQSNDKHLRLMETRSVEAFEQYGNGFWNIITP